MKIKSNKKLKYNPIKPNEEGIIELKIVEVRELIDSRLFIISVQDGVIGEATREFINEEGEVEIETYATYTILNTRMKQLTFDEVDGLEVILSGSGIELEGTYTEKRMQLLQLGLLYITQNDPYPIYFSASEDWELA